MLHEADFVFFDCQIDDPQRGEVIGFNSPSRAVRCAAMVGAALGGRIRIWIGRFAHVTLQVTEERVTGGMMVEFIHVLSVFVDRNDFLKRKCR